MIGRVVLDVSHSYPSIAVNTCTAGNCCSVACHGCRCNYLLSAFVIVPSSHRTDAFRRTIEMRPRYLFITRLAVNSRLPRSICTAKRTSDQPFASPRILFSQITFVPFFYRSRITMFSSSARNAFPLDI